MDGEGIFAFSDRWMLGMWRIRTIIHGTKCELFCISDANTTRTSMQENQQRGGLSLPLVWTLSSRRTREFEEQMTEKRASDDAMMVIHCDTIV